MRYITIPHPVVVHEITLADGSPGTLSLAEFVTYSMAPEPGFRDDDASMVILLEVTDALSTKVTGEVVPIENAHVEKVLAVFRQMHLKPELARYAIRLMRAFSAAPQKAPGTE